MIRRFNQSLSQKEKSIKQLYTLIKKHGPISTIDLSDYTGMKIPTCSRLMDEMAQLQLIRITGVGESKGGRKPNLYEINPNKFYLIGVDISRRTTNILLLDLKLNIKSKAQLLMDNTSTPTVTIDFIEKEINKMLISNKISKDYILGVGIGAIGPLDRENGIILRPVNFPSKGWVNVPIVDILSKSLGIKVFMDYGINTALIAEYQNEFYKSYKNVIYVIKGVGNRTGLILDSRMAQGSDHLGMYDQSHITVDIHGRKCTCGNYGCVRAYSSIEIIRDDVINSLKQGDSSLLNDRFNNPEKIQFEDICQAVNEKDHLCTNIVRKAAYYTGMGLSNFVNPLHPDLIILDGPFYTKMNLFYDIVKQTTLQRSKAVYPTHEIKFSRGLLGENATAIGAGSMVFNSYLS